MVARGVNCPPAIYPVRSVGAENQHTFSVKDREKIIAPTTYKIVFEPDTLVIINLSHPKCRGLQRIIDRPERRSCCVAESGSTMAGNTVCLPVVKRE
jgi:hypothetical protein